MERCENLCDHQQKGDPVYCREGKWYCYTCWVIHLEAQVAALKEEKAKADDYWTKHHNELVDEIQALESGARTSEYEEEIARLEAERDSLKENMAKMDADRIPFAEAFAKPIQEERDRLKGEVERLEEAARLGGFDLVKVPGGYTAIPNSPQVLAKQANRLREALEEAINLGEAYLSEYGSSKHCIPSVEDEIEATIERLRRALSGGEREMPKKCICKGPFGPHPNCPACMAEMDEWEAQNKKDEPRDGGEREGKSRYDCTECGGGDGKTLWQYGDESDPKFVCRDCVDRVAKDESCEGGEREGENKCRASQAQSDYWKTSDEPREAEEQEN